MDIEYDMNMDKLDKAEIFLEFTNNLWLAISLFSAELRWP